jgi:hypothetical protein
MDTARTVETSLVQMVVVLLVLIAVPGASIGAQKNMRRSK